MALTGMALLQGAQFETVDTPLLLEHGDEDALVPFGASQDVYDRACSPKFFVTLHGEDHLSAFHGGSSLAEVVVERTTIDFLDRYVAGEHDALARLLRDGDVTGVATIVASP